MVAVLLYKQIIRFSLLCLAGAIIIALLFHRRIISYPLLHDSCGIAAATGYLLDTPYFADIRIRQHFRLVIPLRCTIAIRCFNTIFQTVIPRGIYGLIGGLRNIDAFIIGQALTGSAGTGKSGNHQSHKKTKYFIHHHSL